MILGEELQEVINKLLLDFKSNPCNGRYATPFCLSRTEYKNPLWFFLWSPIEQYGLTLNCVQHNQCLKACQWTSDFVHDKRRTNPRLLFCLSKNVVLIQRFYRCTAKGTQCSFISASKDFMDLLPREIFRRFEFKMYSRSAYSFQLIDYLFQMVAVGNNFQQICESIANLKVAEAFRNDTIENILKDVLVSFPSNSKLEEVFLDVFYSRKSLYEEGVTIVVPKGFLTVHHTFKIAENVGGLAKNLKKIIKFDNLFVVLDKLTRVVAWKLTSVADNSEVHETLEVLGKRITSDLRYVITDNCCADKELYQHAFDQDILIKQDILHLVQRITTKFFPGDNTKLAREFRLVFRATGDTGFTRSEPTPEKEILIENLNNFLEANSSSFDNMTPTELVLLNEQLTNVGHHINQGCLSNIGVGHGSENVSRLHRMLNRSLRTLPYLGQELLTAMFTVLFYYHNKKIDGEKHRYNVDIVPVFPPPMSIVNPSASTPLQPADEPERMVDVSFTLTDEEKELIEKTFTQIKAIIDTFNELKTLCKSQSFSAEHLLKRPLSDTNVVEIDDKGHDLMLQYNLSAFHLMLAKTEKDGDSCFRSILNQAYVQAKADSSDVWKQYLLKLGLTLDDVEKDVEILRTLIVEEWKQNVKYEKFLAKGDIVDVETYKDRGVFTLSSFHLITDACANVLRIPITVIQSDKKLSIKVVIPADQLYNRPLFITFNMVEGHCSSTTPLYNSASDEETKSCHCNAGCSKTKSRCPCVKDDRCCSTNCKCQKCENDKIVERPIAGCCCGRSGAGPKVSCTNEGKSRKSKCPCLRGQSGCHDDCLCNGCVNPFGKKIKQQTPKRTSMKHSGFKRRRTDEYLAGEHQNLPTYNWTFDEVVCVFVCAQTVFASVSGYLLQLIQKLFDTLIENCEMCPALKIRSKTQVEVEVKLKELGFMEKESNITEMEVEKET